MDGERRNELLYSHECAKTSNELQKAIATIERLRALLCECRDWRGPDGDGITTPLIWKILDEVGWDPDDCE